jgi:hypothetical protein
MYSLMRMLYAASGEELNPKLIKCLNYKNTLALDDLPHTKPSYLGREPDADWRQAAAERIEQYRKGPMRIRVFDANGNPVSDAEVRVAFQKHAYHFGSAVSANRIVRVPKMTYIAQRFWSYLPRRDLSTHSNGHPG